VITDKVQVEGTRVVINTDSEATARAIAAGADRQIIRDEGRPTDRIDGFFDELGDRLEAVIDGLNRPSLGILGWALAVVASVMAFSAFGRLQPQFELMFGIVGVIVILAIKLAVARWAKATNLNLPQVAETYKYLAWGGMALVLVVSVAFQAAVSEDVETGTLAVHDTVDREDREIREAEFAADQLVRPTDTSELLLQDIERRMAQTAQDRARDSTEFTIGTVVGAGPRDEAGLLPSTFCMPNKTMQGFIDRYCPDLIDMEKGYQRRLVYERALAAIAARKVANDEARRQLPTKSSSLALVDQAGAGANGNLWGIAFVAFGMLFVEAGMAFCAYYSKRHPKGVTAALAVMAPAAAAPPPASAFLGKAGGP
jgi:hypothetical protein